jgi:hypothetical protein
MRSGHTKRRRGGLGNDTASKGTGDSGDWKNLLP